MSAQTAGTYTTRQAKDHLLVPESTRAGLGNGVGSENSIHWIRDRQRIRT